MLCIFPNPQCSICSNYALIVGYLLFNPYIYILIELRFFFYLFTKRESTKPTSINLETTMESSSVCPWDEPEPTSKDSVISVSVCPWEDDKSEPIMSTAPPK